MINLIALSDRQQPRSWGEGGISSPTAAHNTHSSLITTSIKRQIYCKMPAVAITLVCLLWLQPPESRIHSAYHTPPLLFQPVLPHIWAGRSLTQGGDQEGLEDGCHSAPGTAHVPPAHRHSSHCCGRTR